LIHVEQDCAPQLASAGAGRLSFGAGRFAFANAAPRRQPDRSAGVAEAFEVALLGLRQHLLGLVLRFDVRDDHGRKKLATARMMTTTTSTNNIAQIASSNRNVHTASCRQSSITSPTLRQARRSGPSSSLLRSGR